MKGADPMVMTKAESQKALADSRKSAKKREAIILAAIEIINAKSFALATMTEIAAALGLRDAALYYYFPNKQALVYACHVQSLQRFEQTLLDAEAAGGTGAAKLKAFLHSLLVDAAQNGPQLYFGDYSYLDPEQRSALTAWGDRVKRMLETFLDQGMVDGSVARCEAALVVQLLLGMLIWLPKWVQTVDGMTVERLMSAIGAICLNGLEIRQPQA